MTTDVETLKEKDRVREDREHEGDGRRSRSRSPCSHSREQRRRSPAEHRSWADRMESYDSRYTDEEDGAEHVVEVSERTHQLLSDSGTRSLTNESRKRTRNRYNLTKVDVTRTPKLDPVMKTLAPQQARSADKELARIQIFLLDAMAPISAILERVDEMAVEDVREVLKMASALIGNANMNLSHLRREKLVTAINNNLTPLIQDDSEFAEVVRTFSD